MIKRKTRKNEKILTKPESVVYWIQGVTEHLFFMMIPVIVLYLLHIAI